MSLGEIMLRSQRGHYKDAFATNDTSASFAALTESASAPSGGGVHHIDPRGSGYVSAQIMVVPFGTNAANQTFDGRIVGWKKNQEAGTYVPQELLTFACTLGSSALVRAASNTFADTVSVTTGLTADTTLVSPADNNLAWFVLDIMGAEYIEFLVKVGTAVSGNFYWHQL